MQPRLCSVQSARFPKAARKGFTLIELLVVIAIIAILAAILFPVFARARENARRTSCLSNMKQLGLGVMQYTQDYDESFPRHQFYNVSSGEFWAWQSAIEPYMKSRDVYKCPSNSMNVVNLTGGYAISYVPNVGLMPDWGKTYTVNLARVQEAANTVMLTESRSPWAALGMFNILWDDPAAQHAGGNYPAGAPSPGAGQGAAMQHFSLINMTYADGHAKATRFIRTMTPAEQWFTIEQCKMDPGTWWCGWGDNQPYIDSQTGSIKQEYR